MAKTIVGLYEDRTTAHRVLDDLQEAGFGRDHLRFMTYEDGDQHDFQYDADQYGNPDALRSFGVADNEADFYAEATRRGSALIVARVHDTNVDQAVDIMTRHNPIRYEDRAELYASYDSDAGAYSADEMTAERERFAEQQAVRLKELQENLKIGKREYISGGVRVHKNVETDYEEETLRLREEHVEVDRTAVNRAATPGEIEEAFEETTVEMVERAEEAVVEKETLVTGEVAVGKDVNVREETVGGEVRRVRVEVEEIVGEHRDALDFRDHYETTFRSTDRTYDAYRPAYEYGYAAASTYQGRDYDAVEPVLREDYTERYNDDDSVWDDIKDAVRHGYYKAKAAVS